MRGWHGQPDLEPRFAEIVTQLEAMPEVSEVRTVGLLAGVQIAPDVLERDPAFTDKALAEARDRGVISRKLVGNGLQISPPFVIEESELEQIVTVFGDAISAVSANAA